LGEGLTLYCLKVGEGEGIRKQTSRAKQEQEQASNRVRAEQSRQAHQPTSPPEKRQKVPQKIWELGRGGLFLELISLDEVSAYDL